MMFGWGLDMHIARLSAAAIVALSVAACAATPETGQGAKENTGTLLGAVAGGLIGSQFGGGTGERIVAGIAGAAIGGMIGNRIGASMDDQDRQLAYEAQVQALESGRSGTAVPGVIRIPAARDRWFPDGPIKPTGCSAGNTRTRSISTAGRKSPAATRAGIRTAAGPW